MISGSIFHTIRDAGHLVIEEKPEELLHQIQLFLHSTPAVELYRPQGTDSPQVHIHSFLRFSHSLNYAKSRKSAVAVKPHLSQRHAQHV